MATRTLRHFPSGHNEPLAGVVSARHHPPGEDACLIDRPASRRWDRHMSAVRLSLHTGLRVPGSSGGVR
jgi:hypothetical protein